MDERPLVLHLNGLPGVGKSTLAQRWADGHPGTLLLDVDELRTWVGGWRADFAATGAVVRPLALALITAAVAQGQDVVLPQLIADAAELTRFEAAASAGGGRFVEVVVGAGTEELEQRFRDRSLDRPHLEAVHALVEAAGLDHLADYAQRLAALVADRPHVFVLDTATGDVDGAYAALVAAVAAVAR